MFLVAKKCQKGRRFEENLDSINCNLTNLSAVLRCQTKVLAIIGQFFAKI